MISQCLKEWRDPKAKSVDVVQSGVHKKCPMCRAPSKFITPSSIFYKHTDPKKELAISAYKESMARVPCRYFVQSKAHRPFCPFGKDCFYQHLNDDGTPHVFSQGVDESMRIASAHRDRQHTRNLDAADSFFNELFATASDADGNLIRNPLDVIGRFFNDNRLSTALTDLLQGLEPPNPNPQRLTRWSLDAVPNPAAGIRVVPPNVDPDLPPPLEPIPNPRPAPDEGADSDDSSMPPLHDVSDSDESDGAWSDSENEDESTAERTTLAVRLHEGLLLLEEQFNRAVDEMPVLDSEGEEDELPPLEEIPAPPETLTETSDDEIEEQQTPPPFTTDGRGRVIAASDEDNDTQTRQDGRSFLSRVFDVIF